jgi:hypothetical protein
MDEQRFDSLTRAIGATPRRSIVRLGVASFAAVVAARALPVQARQDADQTCAAGLTSCPSTGCVDLQTDLDHCGACDTPCTSQLVAVACRNGECVRADCPPELAYCGLVAGCRDLQSDPAHCGVCDNACASGICTSGACAPATGATCAEGQAECDGVCVDTCCNNQHCGACGNACPAGRTCFEGICDCPKGDCGPITPPNTGAGSGGASSGWAALSAAAAAAFAALHVRSVTRRP